MSKTIKTIPTALEVDGEKFEVYNECFAEGESLIYVHGPRLNLSPFEAEELRDWLTQFLDWYYKEKEDDPNAIT